MAPFISVEQADIAAGEPLPASNAERMKEMLIKRYGVPESAIRLETESIKTVDNLALIAEQFDQEGLPFDRLLGLSTGYHLKRIHEIGKVLGIPLRVHSAEAALNRRAKEHATQQRDHEQEFLQQHPQEAVEAGLTPESIEEGFRRRASRY